jgi:hypothetical protein
MDEFDTYAGTDSDDGFPILDEEEIEKDGLLEDEEEEEEDDDDELEEDE